MKRSTSRAIGLTKGRKTSAPTRFNATWNSMAKRGPAVGKLVSQSASGPTKGMTASASSRRVSRLPTAARRWEAGAPSWSSTGISALPRLAPITSVSAVAGGNSPEAAKVATSRITAMLECTIQVAAMATSTASSGSEPMAPRMTRKVCDCASGAAAVLSSISASRIRPMPTSTRPMLRGRSIASLDRYIATPMATHRPQTQPRSIEMTKAASAVPRLAPSSTASAMAEPIRA